MINRTELGGFGAGSIFGYYAVRGALWGPIGGLAYALGLGALTGSYGEDDGVVLGVLLTLGPTFGFAYGLFFGLVAATITVVAAPSAQDGEGERSWSRAAVLAGMGVASIGFALGGDSRTNHILVAYPALLAGLVTVVAGVKLPRHLRRCTVDGAPATRQQAGSHS